jgi:nucleoside-diphosphate-sugar epimerase
MCFNILHVLNNNGTTLIFSLGHVINKLLFVKNPYSLPSARSKTVLNKKGLARGEKFNSVHTSNDRIISTNIFSIIERQPNIVINSITSTRDYVHVLDIARANVMALEHLQKNGSFTTDIFTGESRTMLDVMKEYKVNGKVIDYTVLGADDASTIPTLDNRHIFDWEPAYTFKQAIRSEIEEK